MKENFFSKKMIQKSDLELQEIVKDKDSYIDEARLAAIWELEKRNVKVESTDTIITDSSEDLEIATGATSENEPIADAIDNNEAKEPQMKSNEPVYLYSKKAIYGFSIFFSTIFGAVIMMYNLKIVNQSKARINVLIFAVLYMVLSVMLIEALQGSTITALILNTTGAFIINEYYWNKYIGKSFVYEPKGLIQAISIAVLVVVVIFVLLILTMPEGLPTA